MKRQFIFFIFSALFHFIFFYWFIHISFTVKNFEERESITDIVLVSEKKLWLPASKSPIQPDNDAAVHPTGKESRVIHNSGSPPGIPAVDSATQQLGGPLKEIRFPIAVGKERLSVDLELSLKSEINASSNFDEIRRTLEEKAILKKNNLRRYLWTFRPTDSNTGGISLSGMDDFRYLAGNPSGINAHRFNIEPWARQVVDKIQLHWSIPLASAIGFKGKVGILAVIRRNGDVYRSEIKDSSNQDTLDQAALLAIRASTPLPEFPDDCPVSSIEAYFVFEYGEE